MAERTVSVRLEAVVSGFQRAMQQATRSVAGLGTTTQRSGRVAGSAMRGLVPIAAAAGVGIAAGISRGGNAMTDFEESATKLRTQIGLTADQADELSQAARNVGTETGIGAQEAVDASFFIASAGLRGEEAMDALERSAQAARIGLGETRDVADLVTSAMNAYGSEVLDVETATDQLLMAVREGKAEAPEFAGAMGQVLPIAAEMGVSFGEVAGNVAAMTRTGTNARTAVIQLRQVLMNLINPSDQARDALAEVGLTSQDLRDQIRDEGLFAALMNLRDAFGDNEEAMSTVFGNARSLMGVLDLLGANADENARIVETVMTDAAGSIEEATEIAEGTTRDRLNRMSANWDEFWLNVGDAAAGPLNWILDDLNKTFTPGTVGHTMMTGGGLDGVAEADKLLEDLGLTVEHTARSLGDYLPDAATQADEGLMGLRGTSVRVGEVLGDTADAADDTAGSFGTAARSVDEYLEALQRATDPVFRLTSALDAVDEAQRAYNEAVEEHGPKSDEAAAAALGLAGAVAGAEAAALDGDLSFGAFRDKLGEWVAMGVITAEQASAIEGRVREARSEAENYSGSYRAELIADTSVAVTRLRELGASLSEIARAHTIRVNAHVAVHGGGVTGGISARASGGPLRANELALVGEEGPELVMFGQQSHVIDADTTASAFGSLMHLMGSGNSTGPVSHTGGVATAVMDGPSGGQHFHTHFTTDVPRHAQAEARHQQRILALEVGR